MKTVIVVAMDSNYAIGLGGRLPWQGQLPADMDHFKSLTRGTTVIMGRNTWKSLPSKYRPLPDRPNFVLSRQPDFLAPGATVFPSLAEALAGLTTEVACFMGGVQVYREALNFADMLEVTLVHHNFPAADTFFPTLNFDWWREVERHDNQPDERNWYPYSFVSYVRLPRML